MTSSRAWRYLLMALVALAALRLAGFVATFGGESLQMDFSAFYTAGEALNAGLSPYESHILASPPIWDGIDRYQHSRFLYPPLVATLFQPVADLPYHVAKVAWMIVGLLALFGALLLSMRLVGVRLTEPAAWITWLVALTFHPLLTFLERGQIDSLTLLLLTGGIALLCTRRREGTAGLLIAAATLLKLHTVLLLPFLVLRRRRRALAGYAIGGVLILILSLIFNGPALLLDYLTVEFPRISRYGEGGTPEMLVDPAVIADLQPGEGLTVKQGRVYRHESFAFVSNASLGRTRTGYRLQEHLTAAGLPSAQTVASLVFFALLFAIVALLHRWASPRDHVDPTYDLIYWHLALVIVLLSAPLTWVMNTIWLLTLTPLLVREFSSPRPPARRIALTLVGLGLAVAALPDHLALPRFFPPGTVGETAWQKYVIAQLLVALGLAGCLLPQRPRSTKPTAPSASS